MVNKNRLIMNRVEYCIHQPKEHTLKEEAYGHVFYEVNGKKRVVPNRFSTESINPKNLFLIKKKLGLESLLILDRIKGLKKEVCIIDHVNRSGYNFLIGRTPYENLPTFPDMSNVYNKINKLEQVVVQTVGPKRYKDLKKINGHVSESVGLLSPVWSYVGVSVFAQNFHSS